MNHTNTSEIIDLFAEKRNKVIKIGVIAAEVSGDNLGAALLKRIKQTYPKAEFYGIGGSAMKEQGLDSFFPMQEINVMGIVDVLKALPRLLKLRKTLIQFLKEQQLDLFIGIDAPDFNLYIEKQLKVQGIKTVHYVSPTVWAWRKKRIFNIQRSVDHMLTLFPFENKIYNHHNIPVTCVGHAQAQNYQDIPIEKLSYMRRNYHVTNKEFLIAVLPGSRRSEISQMLPVYIQAALEITKHLRYIGYKKTAKFVIPAATPEIKSFIESIVQEFGINIPIVVDQFQEVVQSCDYAIVTSGTATLEVALALKPMVICYKTQQLTHAILSRLIHIDCIGLPNLLAGQSYFPELIQDHCTSAAICSQFYEWLQQNDASKLEIVSKMRKIREQLSINSSEVAFEVIDNYLG